MKNSATFVLVRVGKSLVKHPCKVNCLGKISELAASRDGLITSCFRLIHVSIRLSMPLFSTKCSNHNL